MALLEALGDGYTGNEGKNLSADYTKDGVITSQELIVYLEERLAKLSNSRQVPGLYPLKREHDKGQFIFGHWCSLIKGEKRYGVRLRGNGEIIKT